MSSVKPGVDDARALKKLGAACLSCLRNLKPRDGDKRELVQARLQELGEWAVPGSTMQLFGSTACELHAHGADLDLTLLVPARPPPSHAEQQALVRRLAAAFEPLKASGEFEQVEAIDRARVPILKLKHAASKLQCDVSIGNELAGRKTRLLHAYVQMDARVQQLCMIIKYWARRRDLTFRVKRAEGAISFHGAFNSYAWVILVIHFLQTATAPTVLPRLEPHALTIDGVRGQGGYTKKGGWISLNKQSLGDLLLAFFAHYAALPYDQSLCVATARYLPRPALPFDRFYIPDPLAPDEDLGCHLTPESLPVLRRELERARRELTSGSAWSEVFAEVFAGETSGEPPVTLPRQTLPRQPTLDEVAVAHKRSMKSLERGLARAHIVM